MPHRILLHSRRALCILALICLCMPLGACAWFAKDDDTRTVVTTTHNPVSLAYYKAGRTYSAQGRFELAREQYLLAYAAAEGDPTLRSALEQELQAADMMLRTIR
ncbi:hypothetical protein LJC23_01960 [Desulfovibrio sp. OttesenSCG-928-I05]|nr:hypothetical protein [Desulfovibrio sp. OttesenSCG-928-I05]